MSNPPERWWGTSWHFSSKELGVAPQEDLDEHAPTIDVTRRLPQRAFGAFRNPEETARGEDGWRVDVLTGCNTRQ